MQLSIAQMILHAGPVGQVVMLLLLFFSIVSWSIIFMKFRLFRNVRLDSEDFLETFWSSGNLNEASASAEDFPYSPEASVFTAGFNELKKINKIRARGDQASPETLDMQLATMDNLKRALRKAEDEEINKLGSLLPFLATTGSATPFIGLFGTVWGIMNAFIGLANVQSATLAVVAPPIAEALIATAMGLFAAIPAVIAYNRYADKVVRLEYRYDGFSEEFSSILQRHSQNKPQTKQGA